MYDVFVAYSSVGTQALFWKNKRFPHASFIDLTTTNYPYGLPSLDNKGCYKV